MTPELFFFLFFLFFSSPFSSLIWLWIFLFSAALLPFSWTRRSSWNIHNGIFASYSRLIISAYPCTFTFSPKRFFNHSSSSLPLLVLSFCLFVCMSASSSFFFSIDHRPPLPALCSGLGCTDLVCIAFGVGEVKTSWLSSPLVPSFLFPSLFWSILFKVKKGRVYDRYGWLAASWGRASQRFLDSDWIAPWMQWLALIDWWKGFDALRFFGGFRINCGIDGPQGYLWRRALLPLLFSFSLFFSFSFSPFLLLVFNLLPLREVLSFF